MIRRRSGTFLLGCALLAGTATRAVETQLWVPGPAELLRGNGDGVAVSDRARLLLSPKMRRLDAALEKTGALEIWSTCFDGADGLYLGTGPAGLVVHVDGRGRGERFFETGEPMVTALFRRANGDLLAGTSPGGKIFKIGADGRGELWSTTGERYVWAITESAGGNVYIATGERGRVMRVRSDGSAETFFESDEAHIVALGSNPDGGLLAGGAGAGRVYAIDLDGNALVLYNDDLDEATALLPLPAGGWVVATVAAPTATSRRPALRLRLPDGTVVGAVEPGVQLEEGSGPTLRGYIEGLDESRSTETGLRGRIVRIDATGGPVTLWESSTETPLSLATDLHGRILFGTGSPARLYRVEDDDEIALLSTFPEAHLTVLARQDRTVFAGTSNPAALWRVEAIDSEQGAYLSMPFDAGGLARWGSIRWEPSGRVARTEVYTRTGNAPSPDETWSAWGPAQVLADGGPVDHPDGRYAQFRVRFIGAQERSARLGGISLPYETYNRSPRLESAAPSRALAVAERAEFSWRATDPDGDPIEVLLEYRSILGNQWQIGTIERMIPLGENLRTADRERFHGTQEGSIVWTVTDLPEGLYRARLAFSDATSNDPSDGRTVRGPEMTVAIDRQAPTIEISRRPAGGFEAIVSDVTSAVERLVLLRDGKTVARLRSVDGVCDSRRERFEFELPATGTVWSVEGTDVAGNEATVALPAD